MDNHKIKLQESKPRITKIIPTVGSCSMNVIEKLNNPLVREMLRTVLHVIFRYIYLKWRVRKRIQTYLPKPKRGRKTVFSNWSKSWGSFHQTSLPQLEFFFSLLISLSSSLLYIFACLRRISN